MSTETVNLSTHWVQQFASEIDILQKRHRALSQRISRLEGREILPIPHRTESTHTDIMERVALHYGVSEALMRSETQVPRFVEARRTAIFMFHRCGFSQSQIGRWFRRDHSTVHFNIEKARKRWLADKVFNELIQRLEKSS